MKINREGLFCHFLNSYTPVYAHEGDRTTLCQIFWGGLVGAAFISFLVFAGVFLGLTFVLDPVLWTWTLFATGQWLDPTMMGAWPPIIIGAIAAFIYTWFRIEQFLRGGTLSGADLVPAPVRETYRAIKDRYCPIVEVV